MQVGTNANELYFCVYIDITVTKLTRLRLLFCLHNFTPYLWVHCLDWFNRSCEIYIHMVSYMMKRGCEHEVFSDLQGDRRRLTSGNY
jgi:hypothetical protein